MSFSYPKTPILQCMWIWIFKGVSMQIPQELQNNYIFITKYIKVRPNQISIKVSIDWNVKDTDKFRPLRFYNPYLYIDIAKTFLKIACSLGTLIGSKHFLVE